MRGPEANSQQTVAVVKLEDSSREKRVEEKWGFTPKVKTNNKGGSVVALLSRYI